MPDYAYIPRSFLIAPKAFGRRPDATWRAHEPQDADGVAASYFQHRVAYQTLKVAEEKGMSLIDLANRLGISPDRLRRKLYGESPARLIEIMSWIRVVDDITIFPVVSSQTDLMPPAPGN